MATPISTRRELELREFAQRLDRLIKALDISKARFARNIGCERGRLRHWLKGSNYPDTDKLLEIHRVYQVTPDWLLLGHLRGLPSDLQAKLEKLPTS